ncbi:hypothetical protein FGO68_gene7793 [Halteria grandinella]|uniref:Uncharacterized protein n=1 Tax=Halteria grandinella TaxID=5974 RepID=A0A8J8NXK9_HALGN|nr:hypothetical protein FGO68_gene7793 [Halteria grandinella]
MHNSFHLFVSLIETLLLIDELYVPCGHILTYVASLRVPLFIPMSFILILCFTLPLSKKLGNTSYQMWYIFVILNFRLLLLVFPRFLMLQLKLSLKVILLEVLPCEIR